MLGCLCQFDQSAVFLSRPVVDHYPELSTGWAACRSILSTSATIFLCRAATETTGYTLAWTLYLLAKHLEVNVKLEAELDAAGLLVTPARPRPRPFAFADISKLRYMDCVLKVHPCPNACRTSVP